MKLEVFLVSGRKIDVDMPKELDFTMFMDTICNKHFWITDKSAIQISHIEYIEKFED